MRVRLHVDPHALQTVWSCVVVMYNKKVEEEAVLAKIVVLVVLGLFLANVVDVMHPVKDTSKMNKHVLIVLDIVPILVIHYVLIVVNIHVWKTHAIFLANQNVLRVVLANKVVQFQHVMQDVMTAVMKNASTARMKHPLNLLKY